MKILNPLSFPWGRVQPRRSENRPSSITRKFATWGKGAKRTQKQWQADSHWRFVLKLTSFERACALTGLDSDCGGVSDAAGVDGVDGEGVVGGRVQLGHHSGADVRFQIDLAGEAPSGASFQRLWAGDADVIGAACWGAFITTTTTSSIIEPSGSITHLSPLEVQQVAFGVEGRDKEAIASDITGRRAPRQSEGAVSQLTHLQVSGSHHPLRNWFGWEKKKCLFGSKQVQAKDQGGLLLVPAHETTKQYKKNEK